MGSARDPAPTGRHACLASREVGWVANERLTLRRGGPSLIDALWLPTEGMSRVNRRCRPTTSGFGTEARGLTMGRDDNANIGSATTNGLGNDPLEPQDETESVRNNFVDVGRSLSKLSRSVASRGTDTGRGAVEAGRDKLDGAVRAMTFREYRDEVDLALGEITQVLLVMDSRLRVLEIHRREMLRQQVMDD
jgi:hypothetical protein